MQQGLTIWLDNYIKIEVFTSVDIDNTTIKVTLKAADEKRSDFSGKSSKVTRISCDFRG